MKAQVLKRIAQVEDRSLELIDMPVPQPGSGEILVKVIACGVCHTELDEIEGRLRPKLPIILGHEIVGRVEALGSGATEFKIGDRVGIAWIHSACGKCHFCLENNENLCAEFQGTGCEANGGYAEYTVVSEDYAYLIPDRFTDSQAAPLLCAGAIGYRDLRLSGIKSGQTLGLFGFGASAHVGETVPSALKVLEKGGRLVMAVIRKRGPIPPMDYTDLLWDEKEIKSVANITRQDARDFLPLAAEIPIIPQIQEFKLEEANEALLLLKQGKVQGAAVIRLD